MPNLIPLPKKFDLTGGSFPLSGGINCLCGDFFGIGVSVCIENFIHLDFSLSE